MIENERQTRRFTLAAIVGLAIAGAVVAGTSTYTLAWNTIDGGGGTSVGGGFHLSGTIGQHDAGVLANSEFTLQGGFWGAAIGTPQSPPCPADLSGDGVVDGADLGILLNAWGSAGGADLSGDGIVDGADLGIMLNAWGLCPE